MVVVLIASLTTATYAWFTASTAVQVNPISLAVRSDTNVQVGVKFQNFGDSNNSTDYYYNSVTSAEATNNTVSWTGDYTGLGSTLEFPDLKLGGSNAIGTSNYGSDWSEKDKPVDALTSILAKNTVAENGNGNKKFIVAAKGKANTAPGAGGNKTTVDYSNNGVKLAAANKDYLDATIGIAANKSGVNGLYAKITVTTDGLDKTLGVNAAIHFVIKVGGKYIDVQPFGNKTYNTIINRTNITGDNGGKLSVVEDEKKAQSEFYFWIGQKEGNNTYKNDGSEIVDFEIFAYIDGTDTDCVLTSKGGCTIAITFGGTTYDADAEKQFTKLEGGTLVSKCTFLEITKPVPSLE